MRTKHALTNDDARKIATAARDEALKNGWKVSIAVVDDGGYLLFGERLDGAGVTTAATAMQKAQSSALSGRPSKAYEERVSGGGVAWLKMPYFPLEGGMPILFAGVLVGGIGVAGATPAQDAAMAALGAEAVKDS